MFIGSKLRILASYVMVVCLSGLSSSVFAKDRPNILFIAIDDLNDWLGCYGGHPQALTPNIDKFAKEGVLFLNAHCQAPICNPSRVSVFLGKLPSTTGMYFLGPKFRTAEGTKNEITLFQYFRNNGYYLSTMGKVFHGQADEASFDHIQESKGWRRPKEKLRYTVPGSNPLWDWGEVDVPDESMLDYHTADWARRSLPDLAKRKEPFFLAIGFHLPHVPLYASERWFDSYPVGGVQLPAARSDDRADIPEIAKQLTLNPTPPQDDWMIKNDESRHAVRAYLAANRFVDHLVGMVLEGLEKSGAGEDTIVVIWSDHGFHLGEKQRWAKRTLWEESTRVPLVISGPGIANGENCDRPVGLIDLFPTLVDLCGLPDKSDLEGTSLQPLLKNPSESWNRSALCTFGPNNHSLRTERWRYIRYADGSEELYDHANDPNEWTNLAGDPSLVGVVKNLRKQLPTFNAEPLPGSSGSDSPLYGE